ncbi:Short-chain dehydrogenase/reductase SDR [Hyella patelloides LEGE 07179]|uniref:Short-chain dehydrogenase/reductase SDR n=1 Tax=Hyella patelloides LEGE 07179 TaxID=945734 RepID=A0A563VJH9_9CYAN|nr:SDR family oxidoreductase [Hyella patelloides]VEP11562.1 Short-chain dehydrogenase/reductase SDR [Hyella patelloides LEGE 07179]
MNKLKGKIAYIAGGAGNVGEGIVRAFLQEGATVITSSRKADQLEQLRDLLKDTSTEKLVTMTADLGDLASAEKLRDKILDKYDRLDAVVASLGGTWDRNVPMTEVSMEEWQKFLFTNLTTHFVTAKTFLPVLAQTEGSSYTFLGGGAANTPIPNYSLVGIPAAAQLMMAKVIMQEMADSGVRINQAIANGFVNTRASQDKAQPSWLTADEIGKYIAWLASDEGKVANGTVPILQKEINPFS